MSLNENRSTVDDRNTVFRQFGTVVDTLRDDSFRVKDEFKVVSGTVHSYIII